MYNSLSNNANLFFQRAGFGQGEDFEGNLPEKANDNICVSHHNYGAFSDASVYGMCHRRRISKKSQNC